MRTRQQIEAAIEDAKRRAEDGHRAICDAETELGRLERELEDLDEAERGAEQEGGAR